MQMTAAAPSTPQPAIDSFTPPAWLSCWLCDPLFLGRDAGIAPDGTPFQTLCGGGVKPEGDPPPRAHDTEADAWVDFNVTFAEWAAGKARCYFRRMPHAVQSEAGKWVVMARVSFA